MNIKAISPYRKENAIEIMGIIVDFETKIDHLNDALDLIEKGELFSNSFYNKFLAYRSNKDDNNDVIELQLKKEPSKGTVEWKATIKKDSIVIYHYDYRRWHSTKDICLKTINDFATLFNEQKTKSILVGYLDKFFVNDNFDQIPCLPGILFKKNNYLPLIFYNTYLATSKVSFIENNEESVHSTNFIDIEASANPIFEKGKVVRHELVVDTNISHYMPERPLFSELMTNDLQTLKEITERGHTRLKKLFCELLDDSLLNMIGIETKEGVAS